MAKIKSASRRDGYMNMMNKYGAPQDNSTGYQYILTGGQSGDGLTPDMLLSQHYETNGLFTKIIDLPAEEATKHGFSLGKETGGNDYIIDSLDYLNWEDNAAAAIKWARLFGGALCVMLIDDGGGIDEPLNRGSIKSIDEIIVYDRSIVQPDYTALYNYNNISVQNRKSSGYGRPEYYSVHSMFGSFRVHESRCLVFRNGVLPERTMQPIYRFWGIPEYARIKKELREAVTSHGLSVKMLERSVQAIYTMKGLSQIVGSEQGEDAVLNRIQAIDMARNILNTIAIDADGEGYDFKYASLSGVKEVLDATYNMLSAVTGIPQTVLFGRSPAGMNSTGKSDLENYYNYIEHIQKLMLRRNLQKLIDIIIKCGLADGALTEIPQYKLEFNPLWSTSESERADIDQKKAQTEQTRAQTAQIYVDMGALDPSEVRKGLAKQEAFDVETLLSEAQYLDGAQYLDDMTDDELVDFAPENQEDNSVNIKNSLNNGENILTNGDNYDIIKPLSKAQYDNSFNTDAEEEWITINGTHVQVGEDGELKGAVGEKISGKKNQSKSENIMKFTNNISSISRAGHQSSDDYFGKGAALKEATNALVKDLSKNLGREVSASEADRMWDSVVAYSGSEYKKIREAYTDPKNADTKTLEKLRDIDEMIKGSPKWDGGTLYRGINIDDETLKTFKPGVEIDMKGPSSWSSDKDKASGFTRGLGNHVLFNLPSTDKAASITHLSSIPNEKEVLAPSDARYKINGIKPQKKNGKTFYVVDLEELKDGI